MGKKNRNKTQEWMHDELKELKEFIEEQELDSKDVIMDTTQDVSEEEPVDLEEMDEEERLEMLAYLQMKASEGVEETEDVEETEGGEEATEKQQKPRIMQYDAERMLQVLQDFQLSRANKTLAWPETMAVTCSTPLDESMVHDDIKRELAIQNQALVCAIQGRRLALENNMKFTRPDDYFAEMVKTDVHMTKIRQKLIQEAQAIKNAEEAKKLRELKKFGKKVQQEKLLERQKQKSSELEKIKLARRKRDSRAAGLDDGFGVEVETTQTKSGPNKSKASVEKRKRKDEKYGFGGKKKFKKSNTSESTNDLRGFNMKKMKMKAQRPGKSKRQHK